MAIRSGSGALKYPLTNYAQLNAQQSAASASAGGGASASAYGANRSYAANKMRVAADLFNSQQDRNLAAYQADANRNFQYNQAQQEMQFRGSESALDRKAAADAQTALFGQQDKIQQSTQEFQGKQQQLERDFQDQQNALRFQQDQINERAIDAGIDAGIANGDLRLSPAAQKKLADLEADRVKAEETMEPAQKREFMIKYEAQVRGIKRTATPVQKVTNDQQFEQDTIERNGVRYQKDQKTGKWDEVPNSAAKGGDKSQQEQIAAEDKLADEIKKAADEARKPISYKEAMDQAREQLAARRAGYSESRTPPIDPAAQGSIPPAPVAPVGGQPAPQGAGPIPPAPAPQTFNMQPNGPRMDSAVTAEVGGAAPPLSGVTLPPNAPPVPAAPPGRPQPVAGNYSIQDPGAALQGNSARMAAAGPQGPSAYQKPDGTWGAVITDVNTAKSNPNKLPKLGQNDEAAFKALPKGAIFIAPDGQMRIK